jgi:hypothetical protein
MEKSSKNKSKFQREISLMKDMMKLAKKIRVGGDGGGSLYSPHSIRGGTFC